MFLQSISTCPAILLLLILANSSCPIAYADEPVGEEIEVEKIKEKYWDQSSDAKVGVVQNRLYSKKNKIEFGIMGSNISGDPFLRIYTLGASFGYHFTEYFSAHVFGAKAFVSPSSALSTLQNDLQTTTNTNPLKFLYGAEVRGSLLYGKLSLVGAIILYLDAYLVAGGEMIGTASGNDPAPFLGIGSQIHVSQLFSLNLDYRFMAYSEKIIGQVPGATGNLGQDLGSRTNTSGMVTLGISFLF